MPSFHYVALNQNQQELSGVIEAPDELKARERLNELSLSVVSFNILAEQTGFEQSHDKKIFEFLALDKNGKKVTGTIAAADELRAYIRLFDEYQLNILSLTIAGQKLDINTLQAEYEKLAKSRKQKKSEAEKMLEEKKTEHEELLKKVDHTTRRVEEFLKTYGPELKIEERDTLQGYINQLIRIKDSTNLEHIRSTCERMIEHIQKKELFVNEEQKLKESAQMKVETRELLTQLKRTGLQQEINIVKTAARMQENPLLKPFANIILWLFQAQNPEIRRLRDDIKVANGHILSYLKLLITGKSNLLRQEAWESIKTLREEKKRLKLKIASIKAEERMKQAGITEPSYFSERLGSTLGWVLAFYITSYVLSYPFTIKQFPLPRLPVSFYFYTTTFTKGITFFIFILYCAVTIRNMWLQKNQAAAYILYPLAVFTFLLIAINLM